MKRCANCNATIASFETPLLWRDQIVCRDCHQTLSKSNVDHAENVATQTPADIDEPLPHSGPATPPPAPLTYFAPNEIICPNPNCGYRGPPLMKSRTNLAISLSLLAAWVIFGLFNLLNESTRNSWMLIASFACLFGWLGYTIFMHGEAKHCFRCGIRVEE